MVIWANGGFKSQKRVKREERQVFGRAQSFEFIEFGRKHLDWHFRHSPNLWTLHWVYARLAGCRLLRDDHRQMLSNFADLFNKNVCRRRILLLWNWVSWGKRNHNNRNLEIHPCVCVRWKVTADGLAENSVPKWISCASASLLLRLFDRLRRGGPNSWNCRNTLTPVECATNLAFFGPCFAHAVSAPEAFGTAPTHLFNLPNLLHRILGSSS